MKTSDEFLSIIREIADSLTEPDLFSIASLVVSGITLLILVKTTWHQFPRVQLSPPDISDPFQSFYFTGTDSRTIAEFNCVVFVTITNISAIPVVIQNATLQVRGFKETKTSHILDRPESNYSLNECPGMVVFPQTAIELIKNTLVLPVKLEPFESRFGYIYFPFCKDYGDNASARLSISYGAKQKSLLISLRRNPTNYFRNNRPEAGNGSNG